MATPVIVIGVREADRLSTQTETGGMSSNNWWTFKPRFLNLADLHDIREIILDGLPVDADDGLPVDAAAVNLRSSNIRKDKTARNALMNSVTNGPMQLIKDCATSHQMWLALQGRFESRTLATEMQLRDQLTNMKFRLGTSLDAHFDGLIRIRDELVAMGVGTELDDEHMAKRLLQSFPYEEFSCVIESLDEDNLELGSVRLKLVNRHNRLMTMSKPTTTRVSVPPAAFVSASIGLAPCEHCGIPGHPGRWCYIKFGRDVVDARKLSERLQPRRGSHHSSLVAASNGVTPYRTPVPGAACPGFMFAVHVGAALSSMSADLLRRMSGWIIDSGASHHFCYELTKFTTYRVLSSPVVIRLGGLGEVLGIGMGDVQVSYLLNGQIQMATLRDTIYVPRANFNLLSIGVLDEAGMIVTFKSGVCQVT